MHAHSPELLLLEYGQGGRQLPGAVHVVEVAEAPATGKGTDRQVQVLHRRVQVPAAWGGEGGVRVWEGWVGGKWMASLVLKTPKSPDACQA